jgi:hypothetical protein
LQLRRWAQRSARERDSMSAYWGSVVCVVIRPEVQEDQPELLGQHMTVDQLPRDNQPRNLPSTHSQFIDRPQLPGFAPGGGEKAEPRFDVHKFWVWGW